MNINPINSTIIDRASSVNNEGKVQNAGQKLGKTFQDALDSLNASAENSNDLVQTLATGGDVDLHDVMIAAEQNDVNFRVAIAIRDRLVEAYREVMRMAV